MQGITVIALFLSSLSFANPIHDIADGLLYPGARGGIRGSKDFRLALTKAHMRGEFSEFQVLELEVDIDGKPVTLRGMTSLPANSAAIDKHVLFFYGNGDSIEKLMTGPALKRIPQILAGNNAITIFDHPGYGASDGEPSELALITAAKEVYAHMHRNWNLDGKTIVVGHSLGSAVAIQVAASVDNYRALLLLNPFDSLQALLGPLKGALKDNYDSASFAAKIHGLAIISHGKKDMVVPFRRGQSLYRELVTERKVFLPNDGRHTAVAGYEGVKIFETVWAEIAKQL